MICSFFDKGQGVLHIINKLQKIGTKPLLYCYADNLEDSQLISFAKLNFQYLLSLCVETFCCSIIVDRGFCSKWLAFSLHGHWPTLPAFKTSKALRWALSSGLKLSLKVWANRTKRICSCYAGLLIWSIKRCLAISLFQGQKQLGPETIITCPRDPSKSTSQDLNPGFSSPNPCTLPPCQERWYINSEWNNVSISWSYHFSLESQ